MPSLDICNRSERTFKILSVDGGGFKGLYAASLLAELERANGAIIEHFDMLCGTSTGALIVLPLASEKTAAEVVEFYRKWGPSIFPEQGRFGGLRRWLRFALHKSKYDDAALRRAAKDILGEKRMTDANCYLCVPAFDFTLSKPRVFKTNHAAELTRDNMMMSEVALATAAAPLFFPIATCQEEHGPAFYIDGGIWANNPALVGLLEACRFFVGPGRPYGSVRILSIANVSPSCGRLASNAYSRSLLGFAGEILEAASEGQQQFVDHVMSFLGPALSFPVEYVRIPAPDLSAKQSRGIQLDIANTKAIDTLTHCGATVGHQYKSRPEIASFFAEHKIAPDWRT